MAKHKYIETAERMWELFCAYRDELKSKPLYLCEQKKGNTSIKITSGKDGASPSFEMPSDIVRLPLQRPLTMEGFENYLFTNDIISDVSDYFENKDGRYSDYLPICRAIKRMIRQDQIEGGMVNIYNPSITQRLNGLVEKTENKHEVNEIVIKKE
mgnify:CR=1 FL=1